MIGFRLFSGNSDARSNSKRFAKQSICPKFPTAMELIAEKKDLWPGLGPIAFLLIFPGLWLAACSTTPPPRPTVTHVVLMWLKHPQRAADRAQLIRAANSLRMIPGVLRVEAGRSALPAGPYLHRDFDLGVVITFRDRAVLQRYERDPLHLDAMRPYLELLVRHYEVYNLSGR